MQGV
jgi:hypothetical protein